MDGGQPRVRGGRRGEGQNGTSDWYGVLGDGGEG